MTPEEWLVSGKDPDQVVAVTRRAATTSRRDRPVSTIGSHGPRRPSRPRPSARTTPTAGCTTSATTPSGSALMGAAGSIRLRAPLSGRATSPATPRSVRREVWTPARRHPLTCRPAGDDQVAAPLAAAGRRLSLTDRSILGRWHLDAEIWAGGEYGRCHLWAAAFFDAGFAGIWYSTRHSVDGDLHGLAIFGKPGLDPTPSWL